MKKLIIIGDGETAELANDYFSQNSKSIPYLHAVDKNYQSKNKIGKCKVITIEKLEKQFDYRDVLIFVAIGSNKLSTVREKYYNYFKNKNYKFFSYVSPKAFVWKDVKIGDNAFILENNVIQKGCFIGNNVTIWSGNHIGHRSIIGDHSFITSHSVISGYCNLGRNSFLGVNCTIIDQIKVEDYCFINAGSLIKKNCKKYSIINPEQSETSKVNTKKFFNLNEI